MIDKKILFIDDTPDSLKEQLELVIPKLQVRGINVEADIMDVSKVAFFDEDRKLVLDEIFAAAQSAYFSTRYSVVACDLNLKGGGEVAGYHLLKKIINSTKSSPYAIRLAEFVFYSAQTEKLNHEVLKQDELERLIRLRITGVFQREKVCEEIGTLLRTQCSKFSFGKHLAETLSEYSGHFFQSGYPQFKGKTIGDVVQEIENQTHHGVQLERLFIELTVSNIVKLNIEK